ncbi:MAG: GHMP kinase [Megasphaera sp.]|jgi:L-threonine kinase|nr:GHMP kinase [Megasphaera sp.]MCI1247456.1 GHMP kinase [Megasphaera sp.]
MELIVRVPGSCGELIQGYWHHEPFLVTCPIGLYTTVTVSAGETVWADLGPKACQAVRHTLTYIGETEFPFRLSVSSQLPPGKGMASSSADIGAVMIAVAAVFGKRLEEEEVAMLAAAIEPTDGVFCRGVVAIQYETGRILRRYGLLPPMPIAIFDTGGTIDTIAFHAAQHDTGIRNRNLWENPALHLLNGRLTPETIGAAATGSARANQHMICKKELESLISLSTAAGAAGVCVAHSGTVLGVLFFPDTDATAIHTVVRSIQRQLPALTYLTTTALQSGGCMIEYHE